VINVGIAGLGRSGWDIHARTLAGLESKYRVLAVADSEPDRCREATQMLGSRTYSDVAGLLHDQDVQLVIIATPSNLHADQVTRALEFGKHVVCEKPMALSVRDADRMIDAAQGANRLLSVFQNMRYCPDFLKVREILQSGLLGRIVQIKITMHRFARRWDWQTLREFGGGSLFNAGAHLVDLALQLCPMEQPQISADLQRTLCSGDAEDHAKIMLRSAESPTVEVEISNACAYPQDAWHVMGTSGGLRGTHDDLHWKWLDLSTLPQRPVDRSAAAVDRRFNREDLPWKEQCWARGPQENPDYNQFYVDLYESLRRGVPPVVTPQSVRRTLAILERCRAQGNAHVIGNSADK
jgi:scyllo-inositol 2-dehydrogenase (NADP+)